MINAISRTLGVLLFLTASAAIAQNSGTSPNEELANARTMIQQNQEAIIREDLRLTAEQEAAFWPLYRKYRADLSPIQDRYVELVADYMQQYQSGALTDESAEEMLDDYFDIKGDLLRERERYIRQFKKILPMLKVARFYQLETKLIANVDAELALTVPLAE